MKKVIEVQDGDVTAYVWNGVVNIEWGGWWNDGFVPVEHLDAALRVLEAVRDKLAEGRQNDH